MDKIGIETTQNVLFINEVASVAERLLAAILDYIVLGVYAIIIGMILSGIHTDSLAVQIILFLPTSFYHLVMEASNDGRSLGKMIMKIKVIRKDGAHPTLGNYLIRWIFRLVDVTLLLGGIAVVTIIFNGKGQRLGDIVANTTVIRTKQKANINDTLYVKVSDDYHVKYNEVERLSEEDIRIVKEVVSFFQKETTSQRAVHMAAKTKEQIMKKLNITTMEKATSFLKTIIKDYNYLNRM